MSVKGSVWFNARHDGFWRYLSGDVDLFCTHSGRFSVSEVGERSAVKYHGRRCLRTQDASLSPAARPV